MMAGFFVDVTGKLVYPASKRFPLFRLAAFDIKGTGGTNGPGKHPFLRNGGAGCTLLPVILSLVQQTNDHEK